MLNNVCQSTAEASEEYQKRLAKKSTYKNWMPKTIRKINRQTWMQKWYQKPIFKTENRIEKIIFQV